ncbi:proline/glycine betaine ABC transporter ATP-binding protein [Clostridium sporogenes]|jgi:osmoprotectant transport system ATP-binding protein|uniref:Quaternary amine transport ATP-binding protein n=2 Tax=Clostridium TaxID=1485 RepID=A0AAE4Z257_CLOSG|nr:MULTISPECIES: betaine/proline/choline family ABC transporter ATP-binding protein [Clostridium]EKS4342453.1 betaine/proline/choline family ABC transporter ATP-binding protein [Clostridium botulinum]MBE6076182.1 ATP-binding cassette domain-containing protein [Clostridium lundense]EKS4393920.1 betaine/proline/choline family ABC transporter ATP-binding protein [Clostridium botulinum]MCR1975712.1 betaine/proline/choline family ABC transporter ATP-binding protein [Clostridium sporogenes]MCW607961
MKNTIIEFKNIKKNYKDIVVIEKFNLEIEKGNLVVLIGSSGSGKTTLLKMINRLIESTAGEILVNGKNIKEMDPIKLRRSIGYVIQQTGLFPHLTVKENIEIIPKLMGKSKEEIDKKTNELLNMVGLDPEKYMDRYPVELSGGQQQRVGVARAFAANAEIILMDEPFSALDPITRTELQEELFNIQKEYRKTIVFVTHDMDEALNLADKICILKDGKLLQYDTPENILKNPAGEYVEEFVGKNKIWTKPEMIKAEDVMITNPVTVTPKRNLLQAREIMRDKKVDSLLVIDKERNLLGYIKLEYIRKIKEKDKLVEEVMNKEPKCVLGDTNLPELLDKFNSLKMGYLPVSNNEGKLLGLITRSSLIAVLSSQYIDMEGIIDE